MSAVDEVYARPRCRVCGGAVRMRADETAGKHSGTTGTRCRGQGRPVAGLPPCGELCDPVGTIGYPVPYERGEAHRSTVVCDSPRHQAEAAEWVKLGTGQLGIFTPYGRR